MLMALGSAKELNHSSGMMKTMPDSKPTYILDTYAWVEYFIGSDKGQIILDLFKKEHNTFITLECCLAELKAWALREDLDFNTIYDIVRKNSLIQSISIEEWLEAASIRHEMRKTRKRFGLIDALLLAHQKKFGGIIVTGDQHFEGISDIIYLQ